MPPFASGCEELGLEIVPPEQPHPGISHQARTGGDRALGEAGARGRHQRGLRSSNSDHREFERRGKRPELVGGNHGAADLRRRNCCPAASVGGAMAAQDWPARPVNLGGALRRRRAGRHCGAYHGGTPERGAGPAGHHRECRRRRRDDRRERGSPRLRPMATRCCRAVPFLPSSRRSTRSRSTMP